MRDLVDERGHLPEDRKTHSLCIDTNACSLRLNVGSVQWTLSALTWGHRSRFQIISDLIFIKK